MQLLDFHLHRLKRLQVSTPGYIGFFEASIDNSAELYVSKQVQIPNALVYKYDWHWDISFILMISVDYKGKHIFYWSKFNDIQLTPLREAKCKVLTVNIDQFYITVIFS